MFLNKYFSVRVLGLLRTSTGHGVWVLGLDFASVLLLYHHYYLKISLVSTLYFLLGMRSICMQKKVEIK